jgi:outer membrane lipoprotein-sorting protein
MKLKHMVTAVIALLLSFNLWSQDARQIAQKANEAVEFDAMEMTATLTIRDGRGNERERQIANASRQFGDATKNLMKFLAPADVKGTAMLIHDYEDRSDDMWIYLPALRKTRRIVSSEKGKSFMGSEFSNADMARPNLDQFEHKLLGSATIAGKECWKVESACLDEDIEDELGFSRQVNFIEKGTYLTRQVEYYDFDGELFKVMTLSDYQKQANGKHFAFRMEMENRQNGRSSVIVIDQFQLGSKLAEGYFSTANLEKL